VPCLPGAVLGGPSRRPPLLVALSAASGSGQSMTSMSAAEFPPAPQWFGDILAEARAAMAAPEWRDVPPPPLSLLLPVSQRRETPQRKPTLASVAKQASKAGIEVARYEIKPVSRSEVRFRA
jgi:hypothetical protein